MGAVFHCPPGWRATISKWKRHFLLPTGEENVPDTVIVVWYFMAVQFYICYMNHHQSFLILSGHDPKLSPPGFVSLRPSESSLWLWLCATALRASLSTEEILGTSKPMSKIIVNHCESFHLLFGAPTLAELPQKLWRLLTPSWKSGFETQVAAAPCALGTVMPRSRCARCARNQPRPGDPAWRAPWSWRGPSWWWGFGGRSETYQ